MPREKRTHGTCRRCGCTNDDCSQCIKRMGEPCFWVLPDLCSACTTPAEVKLLKRSEGVSA